MRRVLLAALLLAACGPSAPAPDVASTSSTTVSLPVDAARFEAGVRRVVEEQGFTLVPGAAEGAFVLRRDGVDAISARFGTSADGHPEVHLEDLDGRSGGAVMDLLMRILREFKEDA